MSNAFEQFKTEFATALACRIYTSTCNAYQVTSRTLSEVDKASVLKVDLVLKRLCSGDKVVVHCHAGYHRTGFFIYVLLRRYGLTAHQSLEALRTTRPRTHTEMTYSKGNRPSLADKAETVFNTLFHECSD